MEPRHVNRALIYLNTDARKKTHDTGLKPRPDRVIILLLLWGVSMLVLFAYANFKNTVIILLVGVFIIICIWAFKGKEYVNRLSEGPVSLPT